jgi:hypothetical protein
MLTPAVFASAQLANDSAGAVGVVASVGETDADGEVVSGAAARGAALTVLVGAEDSLAPRLSGTIA